MIKKLLPAPIRMKIRRGIKAVKYTWRRQAIRLPIMQGKKIKIILGAAETWRKGWFSTNENWLDITRADHWKMVFKGKKLLTHIVAEHVFEHLTYTEAATALAHIAKHMESGGRVRIAVPDGYNPNSEYLRHVGINGIGDDAADHKQLLNADTLVKLVAEAGFDAVLVEGYTKEGVLIGKAYDVRDGYIWRSRVNNSKATWDFPDAQTSLIVDGVKR